MGGWGEILAMSHTVHALVGIFLPAAKSIHSFIQFTFLSPWAMLGAGAAKIHGLRDGGTHSFVG